MIIVNYNSGDYLRRAVESLKKYPPSFPYEIIIVDNASCDSSLNGIEDAVIIKLSKNIGFGRGNNLGVEKAKGKLILFLNSDAEVLPKSLDSMADLLKEERIGASACRLVYGNGKLQPSFGIIEKGILGEAFDKFLSKAFIPLYIKRRNSPFPVKWISAAAVMTRKDVLEKIGGCFDPAYFLYMEDVDLCKRFREAGYRLLINPGCKVIHHLGKSMAHSKVFIEAKRSQLIYYRKWKGPVQRWLIEKYLHLRLGKNFKKIMPD